MTTNTRKERGKRRIQPFAIRHRAPPHPPTAFPHPQQTRHHTKKKKEGKTIREDTDSARGAETMQRCRTQPRQGTPQHTPHPPFNKTTKQTRRGTPTHRRGTPTFDGESVTLPPFTHHATHHPLCHPTIHDGPTLHHDEGGMDRGYPTTRTAQTYTHHPHTTHPAIEQCTT